MLINSTCFSMDSPLSFYFTGALSITPIGFSMYLPLSFSFLGIETLGRTSASTASLRADDLVKGFLILILATEAGEDKCKLFPLLVVDLVDEGTSSNSGAGGGEKSLCGK
jgi:hypothetical protein